MHSEDDDFNAYPSSNRVESTHGCSTQKLWLNSNLYYYFNVSKPGFSLLSQHIGDYINFEHGSKKLASLFENSNVMTGGNLSLMYKAPKQPRTPKQQQLAPKADTLGATSSASNNDFNVITVITVQAFKLENNEYKAKGKVGAAFVGTVNYKHCQLILYKQKSEPIAQAVVNSQFWFTVQTNNYGTFYDKHKFMWSILFESPDQAVDFITHIAIAKWNCDGKNSILVQDLVVVSGEKSVENGVLVDISYTLSILLPDNKLEKKLETSGSKQIHVSNSSPGVQSWENMLIGMHVGCKKLIMLPESQLGTWKEYTSDVGKNCCLIITVLVNRIESLNSSEQTQSNLDSSVDQNIKTKAESIEDALTCSPNSTRANLISRMAKMGQATLPFKGARVPTCGISDSSETEEDVLPPSLSDSLVKTHNAYGKNDSKQIPPQPIKVMPDVSSQKTVSPVLAVSSTVCSQTTNAEGGMDSVAMTRAFTYDGSMMHHSPFTNCNSATDPQLSVFLSELRTHNAELRMNINRVSDKVDRVSVKVDHIDPLNRVLDQVQSLEQNILSQFALVNQQNNEINSVLRKCGYKLPNGPLALESDDKYQQLKKENTRLLAEWSQSKNKLFELQVKLEHLQSSKAELQNQLENEKGIKTHLEKEQSLLMNKLKDQLNNQEKSAKSWHSIAGKTASTILHLEKKIEEKKKADAKGNNKMDEIKRIIRNVFKQLLDKFPCDSTIYSSSEIHSVLALVIKACTLEYLQSISNIRSVNELTTHSNENVKETCVKTANNNELVKSSKELQTNSDNSINQKCEIKENISDPKHLLNDCKIVKGDIHDKEDLTKSEVNPSDGCNMSDLVCHFVEDTTGEKNLPKSCIIDSSTMDNESVEKLVNDSQKSVTVENIAGTKTNDNFNTNEEIKFSEQPTCVIIKRKAENGTTDENWRLQPPPLQFDEDEKEADDDWLKM